MPLAGQLADVQASILNAAVDRDAVLEAAAGMLACREAGADDLHGSLLARERLGSTAIGHGIAIPHGRLATLEAPRGALLRLGSAVDFGAADGEPALVSDEPKRRAVVAALAEGGDRGVADARARRIPLPWGGIRDHSFEHVQKLRPRAQHRNPTATIPR